jgi:hypothetical protein
MKYRDYDVTWSKYIENIIEPAEGESKEDVLKAFLEYETDCVLKEHGSNDPEVRVLDRFLSKKMPEFAAFVDRAAKVVHFDTEAEANSRLDD